MILAIREPDSPEVSAIRRPMTRRHEGKDTVSSPIAPRNRKWLGTRYARGVQIQQQTPMKKSLLTLLAASPILSAGTPEPVMTPPPSQYRKFPGKLVESL